MSDVPAGSPPHFCSYPFIHIHWIIEYSKYFNQDTAIVKVYRQRRNREVPICSKMHNRGISGNNRLFETTNGDFEEEEENKMDRRGGRRNKLRLSWTA
jgi:hypothetical protein